MQHVSGLPNPSSPLPLVAAKNTEFAAVAGRKNPNSPEEHRSERPQSAHERTLQRSHHGRSIRWNGRMNASTVYLMVGVVAAIAYEARESEPGPKLTGMWMLLVAWPVFLLAALAIHGFAAVPSDLWRQHRSIPLEDLRAVSLRRRR